MKLPGTRLNIELSPATIVRVDASGNNSRFDPKLFHLLSLQPQANVVVQLKDTNTILPLDVYDNRLPLYNMQEVDIISANKFVIGYVDVKSEEYFYITNDFCKAAGIGFIDVITWLAGILFAGLCLTTIKGSTAALLAFTGLFALWMLNTLLKAILNKKIERDMDELLQTFSLF